MEDEILKALEADLGKSEFEAYISEVTLVLNEIRLFQQNLRRWIQPKPIGESIISKMLFGYPSSNRIYYDPKGVVLLISPWNYPFQLAILPVMSAVAAGNTVVLKPSEHAPHTSKLVKEIIESVFEEVKFSIEQLEEVLTRKIDRVKDDVRNLEDSFESFKRSTNRTIRELKQNISTIQDDINTLNDKVFPPVEEEEEKKK